MMIRAYHIYYEGRYISLQFSVSTAASEPEPLADDGGLQDSYDLHEPLFRMIANSVDILNRYDNR